MGRKLLVADDSVTIQKVIKLALSSEGYDIVGVSGGHEALQVIQGESPSLVLVDVSLPDMNAYDLKRKINEGGAHPAVKFVLMYSAFEKIDEKQAESLGFSGRLIKPFDPSNLRKLVGDLINQEPPALQAAPPPSPPPPPPPPQGTDADLPPMQDMHPILQGENTSEKITSGADISLDLPLGQQDLSGSHTIDIPIVSEERTRFTEFYQPAHEAAPAAEAAPEGLFAVPPEQPRMDANDIRKLTDSTIQMTGLDLGGWSVDESRKMKSPGTTAPAPRDGAVPRRIDDGGSSFLSAIREEPALQVPRPGLKAPGRAPAQPAAPAATTPPQGASAAGGAVPADQIEQVIRRDLEKMLRPMLEKVIRDTVPGLAESIIKKEIEKLLSEP